VTEFSTSSTQRSYSFGPFVLLPERQLLMEGETPVRIGSRALELLIALIERPGELVSKGELLARAWPKTFVEESNLKVNVAALRRALGDGPGGARYIATVSGRGYRFVSPVRISDHDAMVRDHAPPPSRAHNLPNATTRIVGRGDVINAMLRQCEASRLVTLVGAGGIGKTTVALAVAERAIWTVKHGVWFIDLAPLRDPALVPGAIATALGLAVHSANTDAALSAFLLERQLILVLDNCEHVNDTVAACAERILSTAAGVRILATSREPLRARGEQVFRLDPLETPPESLGSSAAEIMAFAAVELFAERAAAGHKGFRLDDSDAPVVAEICRKLEGMALAIELAAARVDALQVREILGLLDDRFRLLKGRRTAPERHQTLTATLDWSYDLLSGTERTLLRRLSVFAGTFGLESACAVAADENTARFELIEDLANLVAKSLVAAETAAGATHYRLLDTTRNYASQKLAESNELGRLRQRHAEYLRDLAGRAEAEWETRPTAEWLAHYGPKVDDIRSALSWAFTEGHNIPIAVALTVAAIPFWEHLSFVEECRACVERALESAAAGSLSDRDEMKLRTALGTTLLHTRGPLPQVKLAWTKALQLAERLGDTEYQLRCLWGLCDYHTWTGDHRSALAIANNLRAVAIDKKDLAAGVNVDRQAGTALRYLGDLAEARQQLERMISRYIPPVVRSDIARFQLDPRLAARGTLANVLWLQGYPDQAVQMVRQQLEGARAADHALALCNALVHAACPIALFVGDLAAAERLLTEIQNHVAKHAMVIWSAMGRCLRGEWLLESGDASGLGVLRDALDELSGVGFRMRYAAHLGVLAKGLAVHGDGEAARVAIDEAITMSERSGEIWCLPELLRIKGDVICSTGSAEASLAAEQLFLRALAQARRQGALSWELRIAISLAEFWDRSGATDRAEGLLRSTCDRFSEGFGTRDLQRARSLLDDLRSASHSSNRDGHDHRATSGRLEPMPQRSS
jgi:predicted ATPase/DNA-binding winged helix-turn-helix (wHTH) protein